MADRPKLFGPDPHSFHGPWDETDTKGLAWIADFMDGCRKLSVRLGAVTHHEYIEVDATSFTSPQKLDVTGVIASHVNATVSAHAQGWPASDGAGATSGAKTVSAAAPAICLIAGEIGPHNGGDPPCNHSTMRWANFGDSVSELARAT